MQILSVALQNFKAHRDRFFEFQPGTNAICGENGAGKTSILEAIAWVLFNHQGDYAKEDLIRNGSGSAQVTVAFTSNHDGRTYQVQRCTQRGYQVFDPQLNQRLPYSRLKDEILPWLRQHLGVSATTNLAQLFARTVGVPQGTFTADFLQPAEQRKAVFDAILKVEDYKLAYKQMNTLRRYAEDQVEAVKAQIDHYQEALAPWPELQDRQQQLIQELQTSQQRLQELGVSLADLQGQRDQLKAEVDQQQALERQRQDLEHQRQAQQANLARLQGALSQAAAAVAQCQAQRQNYQGYQQADQALEQLGQRQQARQRLQQQYQTVQASHSQNQTELVRVQTQLENLAAAQAELDQLRPQIARQIELEQALQTWQQHQQQLLQLALERQQVATRCDQLADQVQRWQQSCDRLQPLEAPVAEIPALEADRDRLQQQISRLAMAQQFEDDLRAVVDHSQARWGTQAAAATALIADLTPLLATLPATANLTQLSRHWSEASTVYTDLIQALEEILADLADQTDRATLERHIKTLEQALQQRYAWRGELAQRPGLLAQLDQTQQEQAQLQAILARLEQQLTDTTTVETQIQSLQGQLEELGRPREKSQILQRTLPDPGQLEATQTQLLANQVALQQQLASLDQQLATFGDLETALETEQTRRRQCQTGYHLYLQSQTLANQHPQIQADLIAAQATLEQIEQRWQAVDQAYQEATTRVNPAAIAALENRYATLRSEADQLAGSLPQQHQRLADLEQQLAGLAAIAQRQGQAQIDLQRRERIKRFINFARKSYNEAGPRITEQYVRNISLQADRLFRELMNRPNVALQWTRDYEIVVQEGANQRRFVNLSGGEQMCAALAVRLALLKVLADLDIAFFDEPTTNMDRSRRQGLAEALGRIKSFAQLFVISHDDTFETITENVISVEREAS
ncbi:MAG: AAA family ATPase [Nodosilinea sp.]